MNNLHLSLIRVLSLVLLALGGPLAAEPMTPEQLEAWFNDNSDTQDPLQRINEGQLKFIQQQPEYRPQRSEHRFTIRPSSLKDGWVALEQCHQLLDAVPAGELVYGQAVRNLTVVSSARIDRVAVTGDTVQLENIEPGARLCTALEIRALQAQADGSYQLRSGPYQRRLLDGYFPMDLKVEIELPPQLRYSTVNPPPQPGFRIHNEARKVSLHALFEGKLAPELRFLPTSP